MSNPKEKDIRRGERFKEVWEDTSQCRLPLVNRPALRCAIKFYALQFHALALFRFGLQCPCKSLLVGALLCRGLALLLHAYAARHIALPSPSLALPSQCLAVHSRHCPLLSFASAKPRSALPPPLMSVRSKAYACLSLAMP